MVFFEFVENDFGCVIRGGTLPVFLSNKVDCRGLLRVKIKGSPCRRFDHGLYHVRAAIGIFKTNGFMNLHKK